MRSLQPVFAGKAFSFGAVGKPRERPLKPQFWSMAQDDIDVNPRSIWVTNMVFGTTEAELRQVFNEFGEIQRVDMRENRRNRQPMAFIHYETAEAAAAAIEKCDGIDMKGRKLVVKHGSKEKRRDRREDDSPPPPRYRRDDDYGRGYDRGYRRDRMYSPPRDEHAYSRRDDDFYARPPPEEDYYRDRRPDKYDLRRFEDDYDRRPRYSDYDRPPPRYRDFSPGYDRERRVYERGRSPPRRPADKGGQYSPRRDSPEEYRRDRR